MGQEGERLSDRAAVSAPWFDHHHLSGDAGPGEIDVLRPDAVLHPLPVGGAGAGNGPAPPGLQ